MGARSDFAAQWLTLDGAVASRTDAATLCWFPCDPAKFRAVSEDGGFETILPCGWCPGCRERARRALQERLFQQFHSVKEGLWIAYIESSLTSLPNALRRARRYLTGNRIVGFFRTSPTRTALFVVSPKERSCVRRTGRSSKLSLVRLKRHSRRRHFAPLTAGMLVSRDDWGPWTKRFYARGLAPLAGSRFQVMTGGGLRKAHPGAQIGSRAIARGLALVPPKAWRLPRLRRRKGPERRRVNRSLQPIGAILQRILGREPITRFWIAPAGANPGEVIGSPPDRIAGKPAGATAFPKDEDQMKSGRGYVGSRPFNYFEWGERMAKLARERQRGGDHGS